MAPADGAFRPLSRVDSGPDGPEGKANTEASPVATCSGEATARNPLYLSEPLYAWDTSLGEEVSFDDLHHRLIHHWRGGFSTANLFEGGSAPDGLTVQCDLDGLNAVRFSPDGLFFAFLCHGRTVGILPTQHCQEDGPSQQLIIPSKWCKPDSEIMAVFWLPQSGHEDHLDLVVVSTQGLEVFRLVPEQFACKSVKAYPAQVRLCWTEPASGMALVCTGSRTLQPFDFLAKSPKLLKFDLVLDKGQMIGTDDVAVLPLYDSTYCIHADSSSGRVSLRNISDPQRGTPEHDVVIDVTEDEQPVGTLRISSVDNLLVVHCLERDASMVFDIRCQERGVVPCISGPCKPVFLSAAGESGQDDAGRSLVGLVFGSGCNVMDTARGQVRRLGVSMDAVLKDYLARTPCDLASVVCFLLRRTACRGQLVWALRQSLKDRPPLNDWAQAFGLLNREYRRCIETMTLRAPTEQANKSLEGLVSLRDIEELIAHRSILSENQMVALVFHPHLMQEAPSSDEGGCGNDRAASEVLRIPIPPEGPPGGPPRGAVPAGCPYIVSVVSAYLRSLLGMQLLPHKVLQCFVFDICMHFHQEHTLQQWLGYHVLLDSPEMVGRLRDVAVARGCAWAEQACLDMALRTGDLLTVADVLLHSGQYLDVVPFLVNQGEARFQIRRLFDRIEGDSEARAADPGLVARVVAEVRRWRADVTKQSPLVSASGGGGGSPVGQCCPDLEGCERWLPELAIEAAREAAARDVAAH